MEQVECHPCTSLSLTKTLVATFVWQDRMIFLSAKPEPRRFMLLTVVLLPPGHVSIINKAPTVPVGAWSKAMTCHSMTIEGARNAYTITISTGYCKSKTRGLCLASSSRLVDMRAVCICEITTSKRLNWSYRGFDVKGGTVQRLESFQSLQ
jgi:hypothetical protein